jgi:hypothetical protein
LPCTSSPSLIPMILRFGLLMELLCSCIFLFTALESLSKSSSGFFFNSCFVFEPWDSVFYLLSTRVSFLCSFYFI